MEHVSAGFVSDAKEVLTVKASVSVSYTHLDVYKRQKSQRAAGGGKQYGVPYGMGL